MITKKLKLMLLPLVALASFASCAWEKEYDGPKADNKEVVFSMRIPGTATLTRALSENDEYTVTTLDVLVFKNSDGTLLSRSTHVGTPEPFVENGKRYANFVVKLEPETRVTSYDFYLVANARDIINTALYTSGNLRTGMDKEEVQAALKLSIDAGTAWDTESQKTIPMWGELIAQPIEANKTYDRATLTRMVAKIDLSVALTNTGDDFQISEVYLYNYQKQGYIAPKAGTAYFEGKAKAPSIENTWTCETTPINYTSAVSGNAVTSSIYVFEAAAGSPANSNYMNNICIVVGGSFNGTDGFYRLDFANMDAATQTPSYMPILRNHHYTVAITAINGPGFGTKEEAYNSKPVNVATEIVRWEDGEYVEGIWNGNHHIFFSTLEANFTQFGEPTPQVVSVKSDLSDIKFNGFQNTVNAGPSDAAWSEAPTGTWTNGHFTVVTSGPVADGSDYVYTLTITATPTTNKTDDPARHSFFKIVGSNLDATFNIRQDAHLPYMLKTDPAHQGLIRCSGEAQTVAVKVSSTHNYDIELNGDMFGNVYTDATKATQIYPLTNIDKDTYKTVYVEVNVYKDIPPRAGTIGFTHNTSQSDAGASIVTVIQMTPMITAQLTTGERYKAEIPKAGGSVTIDVKSNMSAWIPVLERKTGTSLVNEDLSASVDAYFTPANGSANQTVTFQITTAIADGVTDDDVYYIYFKDASGDTKTAPVIEVTHKAKILGGGGGGTPPTGGVLAPEGILAVDADGVLNLDGPARPNNYIVYFRWGSMIATAGGANNDVFDKDRVAWTPEGYDYDALMADIGSATAKNAWSKIPYIGDANNPDVTYLTNDVIDHEKANPVNGVGDPCRLAVKENSVGNWRMPTGSTYPQSPSASWSPLNGVYGHWYNKGQADQQFYPAVGLRYDVDGVMMNRDTAGYIWSATRSSGNSGCYLFFGTDGVYPGSSNSRIYGQAVRCVPK